LFAFGRVMGINWSLALKSRWGLELRCQLPQRDRRRYSGARGGSWGGPGPRPEGSCACGQVDQAQLPARTPFGPVRAALTALGWRRCRRHHEHRCFAGVEGEPATRRRQLKDRAGANLVMHERAEHSAGFTLRADPVPGRPRAVGEVRRGRRGRLGRPLRCSASGPSARLSAARFHTPVWTVRPRHSTSRGRPTLTATSRPTADGRFEGTRANVFAVTTTSLSRWQDMRPSSWSAPVEPVSCRQCRFRVAPCSGVRRPCADGGQLEGDVRRHPRLSCGDGPLCR
jgi:hypothetical protein